jgi:hypothetical protein
MANAHRPTSQKSREHAGALRVASAIVCDGVSTAAVVFAPEYGNEDEHQI